ncbi:MAG: M28 family peptidase [Prevotellaceae bacterium]|nr:M28 family peptidase [Prevotellaceae bacterium]
MTMKKLLYLIAISLVIIGCKNTKTSEGEYVSQAPSFDEDSAYTYIAEQCAFGPRTMNSVAHDSCGDYIAEKFRGYGAKIYDQYADGELYDGTPIKMRNIIASFNPDAPTRLIISGHWDSRPWADHDSDEERHHTPIDGANDGGSSIGIMIEIARQLMIDANTKGDSALFRLNPDLGIDFICWDAEDCGTPAFAEDAKSGESTWCLGSQYWSGVRHVERYTARYAINLDMVGGNQTVFYREGYSMNYAPTIVDKVWGAAHRIGYGKYFSYDDNGGYVTDDHLQVNRGGIPCIDVIGTDAMSGGFPSTWHTVNDNIKNINRETLKAVGQTMLEVIWTEQ